MDLPPLLDRRHAEARDRFWTNVEVVSPDKCWPWTGGLDKYGYGVLSPTPSGTRVAHRVAFELAIGTIPEGAHVHHVCGNKKCVNPAHLAPLAPGEHGRHHRPPPEACPRCGSTNFYIQAQRTAGGRRYYCRPCEAERGRRRRASVGAVG